MPDHDSAPTSRDALDGLRSEYLDKVREAFAKAIDATQSFRDLAARYPDDVELRGPTEILCSVVKQLLNTVTVKVAANGMAADWDRLFGECGRDKGE